MMATPFLLPALEGIFLLRDSCSRAVLDSLTLLFSARVLFPNQISCYVIMCVSSGPCGATQVGWVMVERSVGMLFVHWRREWHTTSVFLP